MTASTTEGVTVSASGFTGAGYEGWRAFDNSATTRWAVNATSGILTVALATAKAISGYTIRSRNDTYLIDSPKDWTFEGSADGVNWTILDTRTGQISWAQNELKTFSLVYESIGSYLYYRLSISSNQSGTDLSFSEMELLEGLGYDYDFYTNGSGLVPLLFDLDEQGFRVAGTTQIESYSKNPVTDVPESIPALIMIRCFHY